MSYLLIAPGSTDELESEAKYFCLTGKMESLDERVLKVGCGKFSVQATFENLMIRPLDISMR